MENKIGEFSLGSLRTFRGHEGETCFQGTILKAGKKVAMWSEDSWGGILQIEFSSEKLRQEFIDAARNHPVAINFVKEVREELGQDCGGPGADHSDLVISTVAAEIDLQRRQAAQLKRWCKSKTVLRLPDTPAGEYLLFKFKYVPSKHDASLYARYPGCEIINKQFV